MTHPWDAGWEVDAELALRLVRGQFPEMRAGRAEALGVGWDNAAFLIDAERVFRFPRREIAIPLLATEARVLPRLARRLPLAVPLPEWVGAPSELFPWPFLGYRRLPGVTACGVELSPADLADAAGRLGEFLAALHATPAAGLELPADTLARTDFRSRLPQLHERLGALRAAGLVRHARPWLRLFEEGSLPEPVEGGAVVHGDLYARHLLVDEERRLCGVIDWGDVHVGDVAVDLSVAYGFLPAAARPGLLRAYGPVDEATERRARLRAAFHAVSVTWYAATVGDQALRVAGVRALGNVLEWAERGARSRSRTSSRFDLEPGLEPDFEPGRSRFRSRACATRARARQAFGRSPARLRHWLGAAGQGKVEGKGLGARLSGPGHRAGVGEGAGAAPGCSGSPTPAHAPSPATWPWAPAPFPSP